MTHEEIWKPVVGYEGLYEVSDLGSVRSLPRSWIDSWGRKMSRTGIVLKQTINEWGYPIVKLYGGKGVHRSWNVAHLVIGAFVGPRPPDMEVCHEDGKPGNSALINLRYDTPIGNQADRVKHGTDTRGERHARAKLTNEDVRQIRMMRNIVTQHVLAGIFGIADSGICNIQRGRTWRHIL